MSARLAPLRATAALLLAAAGLATAQSPALQTPIALQGDGPFYRLTLPTAIHGRTAYDDLRDLRVRNAGGQAVPFAWLGDAGDEPAPAGNSQAVPLFAVPAPAGTAGEADAPIGLALRPDGSIALAAARPAAARSTTDWIIDASRVDGALLQARVTLAPAAQGLFAFSLDASDDLRHWRRVADDGQFARLQQAGQAIDQNAIELDHLRTRFLRLRWRDPANAPALTAIVLDSVQDSAPVAAIEWSAPVAPTACDGDHCDYAAPRGLPLQSVRIALAEQNTLAPVELLDVVPAGANAPRRPRNALYVLRHGRGAAPASTGTETLLAETVVYRLQQPGGEARSAALPLDGAAPTLLRLRTHGPIGALGHTPPSLQFGARPPALVFLAQGAAPFMLSWRAAGDTQAITDAAALPLAQLIPTRRAGAALEAGVASIALPALATDAAAHPAPASASAPADSRKPWLWAALGAGLLLLAAMAVSLLRELRGRGAVDGSGR